jgi:hypothetical protein
MSNTHDLFKYIPRGNILNLVSNPKGVVDFLGLSKKDIANATSLKLSTIRYDDKMPKELAQSLLEVATICELVAEFFDADKNKTSLWFNLPNPALGGISPKEMIRIGQHQKLRKAIVSMLEGNTP